MRGDVTVANPYAYAANDPLDKVDPLGLGWRNPCLGSSCFLDGHGALVDTLSDVPTPRQFWNHQRDVGAASVDRFVDQFGEVPTGFDLVNVSLNPGYAAIDRCTDYACGSGAGLDCALSVVDLILTAVGIEQVGVSVGRAAVRPVIGSGAGPVGPSGRPAINITGDGLNHAAERQTSFALLSRAKSVFFDGEDISALVRAAERTAPLPQSNGNFAYVVDAGRPIGVDRVAGLPTSQYTVITRSNGDLVTTSPACQQGASDGTRS